MEHQSPHRGGRGQGPALDRDPIVATATPAGHGGVAVVRISGDGAAVAGIAASLLGGLPAARRAQLARFLGADGVALDQGLALYFPAPHSYTGEHVLELQAHGSPVIAEALVARCVELGARRAGPGEFTERAFLSDKLDLAQAEAVADLINAGSLAAARAAMRSLQGDFSQAVHALVAGITDLRAYVEAAIDFPEEELDFLAAPALLERFGALRAQFTALGGRARQGRLLTEGLTVAIAGAPNVGKSTLLNRLAGHDAAIVTDLPGTTRDVLRERMHIDGMPVQLLDTAGLRDSDDPIELEGMRRAERECAGADRILFVIAANEGQESEASVRARRRLPEGVPVTVVVNKCDLVDGELRRVRGDIYISAASGQGLSDLREHLRAMAGWQPEADGVLAARGRQLEALQRARLALDRASLQLTEHRAGELVAEELRAAQAALGEITGEVSSDELLGHIFSRFCIGK